MASTPKTRLPRPEAKKPTPACDNHPGVEATLQTTSNGAHSLISLCDRCIPKHWRKP